MRIAKSVIVMLGAVLLISVSGLFAKDGMKQSRNEEIKKTAADYKILNYNNLSIPLDNKGVVGDVNSLGGRYKNNMFLFSGGFFLSGFNGSKQWGNGVMSSSRIGDYNPGPVGSSVSDSKNKVYFVNKTDPPFGSSWQDWKDAVSLGADFYDGNHDGVYNPVDLNGNGIWDINEDKPDLIGDFTAWCVYNDGLLKILRRFTDVDPVGIEIHQSVFGFSSTSETGNALFFRYRIINKGTVNDVLDSVIFSAAIDPDLGDYRDDLVGCDTIANSGYVYQTGSDNVFGSTTPSFLVDLLQGPISYIPGVTFTDVNKNGKYDPGTDIPLKNAYNVRGVPRGIDTIAGAVNLSMSSFTQYFQSHPSHGDPSTQNELRNFMIGGRGKDGTNLNPCNWVFGNGNNISNCKEINPKFMYSGDPVKGPGWINSTPSDQRFIMSTGLFKLEKNRPVDIVIAYIIGEGSSSLNSVTKVIASSGNFRKYFNSNFSTFTDVKKEMGVVNSFELFQNYPNPFNPSTTIRYSLPAAQKISLKVYNTLGQLVSTLVDEVKPAGANEAVFDGSRLSSGVYFYELKTKNEHSVKKLTLVK